MKHKNRKAAKRVERNSIKEAILASFANFKTTKPLKMSAFIFTGFVVGLLILAPFIFIYTKIAVATQAMTPFAKDVYSALTENKVKERADLVVNSTNSIHTIMRAILTKLFILLSITASLFALTAAFFSSFVWKQLFENKTDKIFLIKFFALNLIWLAFWTALAILTLWLNLNAAGLFIFFAEILVAIYLTRFIQMRFFITSRIWRSFAGLADAFRPRSLLWLAITLPCFILLIWLVASLFQLLPIVMLLPSIAIVLAFISWSKMLLFLLHHGKKEAHIRK